MRTVIYAFRSPGSGAVYVGKHQCNPDGWPRRGTGPLPDGYRGSGVAVVNFHRCHGAAVQWRILAVVDGDRGAVDAAERRAIRLARSVFGRRCVNRQAGGEGMTSEDARALLARPEVRERLAAANRARAASPEGVLQLARAQEVARASGSWKQGLRDAQAPAARDKQRASLAAYADTPEGKAHHSRAGRLCPPEARAKGRLLANTPEARAKGEATRLRNFIRAANARNKARRAAEQEAADVA